MQTKNKTMKSYFLSLSALFLMSAISAQITTAVNSIPDAGDNLAYKTLDVITDQYESMGEGITWDFTGMLGETNSVEVYLEASSGVNFSQFSETDLLINYGGADGYANRNTTNIALVGITGGQLLEGVDLPSAQTLSEPYVIRRAPMGYEDSFSGSTSFGYSLSTADFGPLADIFADLSPLEGATIDSIRITFTLSRTETVDSYGEVILGDEIIPALRLVQNDETEVEVDIYANAGFIGTWISISRFVDADMLGLENLTVTNYIFLDENSKEYILEVNVDGLTQIATGKYNANFTNSISEEDSSKLAFYPNPIQSELVLSGASMSSVSIMNQLGQEVESLPLANDNSHTLSLEDLIPGMYAVNVTLTSGEVVSEKIIKE